MAEKVRTTHVSLRLLRLFLRPPPLSDYLALLANQACSMHNQMYYRMVGADDDNKKARTRRRLSLSVLVQSHKLFPGLQANQ